VDKNSETLQHISDTLDEVLVVLKTKPSLFVRIITLGAAIAGTIAIVTVIEPILKWVFGG